jgi:hypothetical protein
MTSYDDRPNQDPWVPPAWSPPPVATVRPPAAAPGIETRQVLLALGAACLVAALAAGTAVVWHALGPTGQAALMAVVTAVVLTLAVRLERLPATAQALGAVGVAGLLIDAVAARSLDLAGVRELPLHVYAGLAASAVAVVLGAMAGVVRRLWAPPVGAGVAAMVASVAWVDPTTIDRAAWLGAVAAILALLVERVIAGGGAAATGGRIVTATLAVAISGVSAAAALLAASEHSGGAWGGVALVLLLLALPEVPALSSADVEIASSVAAGVLGGALVIAATQRTGADVRVMVAGAFAAVGAVVAAVSVTGRAARLRWWMTAASTTVAAVSYALLSKVPEPFAHLNVAFAVVSIGVAVGWPRRSADSLIVRSIAGASGVVFASLGVDIMLQLHDVRTPELYVLVPAVGMIVLGAAAMLTWPETSSWVLAPGLVFGLLPTVTLALGDDPPRQAVALAAAAALVVIGAQTRLVGPLAVGAGLLSLVTLRVVGPEMTRVPEWVALGVVGTVLLTLGATWEARMLDLRRAAHALRPRIAALR